MIGGLVDRFVNRRLWIWAVIMAVLLGAFLLGSRASVRQIALIVLGLGAAILLQRPILGLPVLVVTALIGQLQFGTGTAVALNQTTLLVPALLAVWVLDMMRRRELKLVPSATTRPLVAFLLAGLLSLLIGSALWDPAVPRSNNLIMVQFAQWAIFAFSAGAFWLMGNLVQDQIWLRRLTFLFLIVAGCLAIFFVLPGTRVIVWRITSFSLSQAPFWMLLTALASGQLLFNKGLSASWRVFLLSTLAAVFFFAFSWKRQTVSFWVGVVAVLGTLAWLRFPRLRWVAILVILALVATGLFSSAVYEFAGGDAEWQESGGSRMALIGRVVEVTMRNPITGLGPAAYRSYAGMQPLAYGGALWLTPVVNSHNNYVDLFAHTGLLGLGLFFWFAVELTRKGLCLRRRFTAGFAAGYLNAMLAAGAGALTLMLLADWILPHVYNVGFPGFQASALVWLFLGGLTSLDASMHQGASVEVDRAA